MYKLKVEGNKTYEIVLIFDLDILSPDFFFLEEHYQYFKIKYINLFQINFNN